MAEAAHRFQTRVFYEDTDMGGIVYHANYLKFIERARSDWVRSLGLDQNALREAGLVFAVRRIEADFLRPARFDDSLEVVTTPVAATAARVELLQEVLRAGAVLFSARVTLAAIGPGGRPVRMPPELGAALGVGAPGAGRPGGGSMPPEAAPLPRPGVTHSRSCWRTGAT